MADLDTPAFDLAFRFAPDGKDLVYTEQDELPEISNGVEALLRTRLGQVEELPDFGITDPLFEEQGVDLDEVQDAIGQWESRADVLLDEEINLLDAFVSRVTLNVQVESHG